MLEGARFMAIVISKLHPMFVGELAGADLSKHMNEVTFGEIQAALDEHAVLLFHGTPVAEGGADRVRHAVRTA
jgi:alpha-ketoglutarate-dependent 2,4-dichlorophenoxyacetate dioxygenase